MAREIGGLFTLIASWLAATHTNSALDRNALASTIELSKWLHAPLACISALAENGCLVPGFGFSKRATAPIRVAAALNGERPLFRARGSIAESSGRSAEDASLVLTSFAAGVPIAEFSFAFGRGTCSRLPLSLAGSASAPVSK